MPPLVLKPQVGWIFSFLSYGICRMKRRRIKGLKTPEQTCLALISLFSGTERQKECSKPEVLLALMRHKYQLWSSKEIPSYCHCHFSAQHSSLLQQHLAWVLRLRTVHVFTSVRRFLCPECSGALSIHPQPLTLHSSGTGSHTEPSTAQQLSACSPSCPPKPPWQHLFGWSEAHKKLSIFWTPTPPQPRTHLRCLLWHTSRNEKDSSLRASSSWAGIF